MRARLLKCSTYKLKYVNYSTQLLFELEEGPVSARGGAHSRQSRSDATYTDTVQLHTYTYETFISFRVSEANEIKEINTNTIFLFIKIF